MIPESSRDESDRAPFTPPAGPSLHAASEPLRPLEESLGRLDFVRRLADLLRSPAGGSASRLWIFRARVDGSFDRILAEPRWLAPAGVAEDPLASHAAIAEAWRSRRVVRVALPEPAAAWEGSRILGAFTFRTDGAAEQLLVAGWDEGDESAEAAFLATAAQARDAARRFELLDSARRAEEQRAALAEWIKAGAAAHHLNEALRAAARAALRVAGRDAAAIWMIGAGEPELVMTAGDLREREGFARRLGSRAAIAAAGGQVEIVAPESGETEEPIAGVARVAFVPVQAYGRVLGVIGAFDAASSDTANVAMSEDRDRGLETLSAIADGLAMVLDRAERTDAARASEQQTRELRARLRRRERLASAGERASGALGEARHPLASIGAFARRAHREMEEGDPRREYLEVILRESERLERLVSESAEPGLGDPPRFRLESLNAVLQDVLPGVGEKLVRRRVRLLKRLDPESPRLLLDVERIRQVFRNVIERAVESVPIGGRVRVESRLVRDHVIAEISYDGGRAPGDLLAELFVPFTPGAASVAPALGVADQIIRRHGGEVRVRADGEWGATVLITLPVRGNEDRRRTGEDRRFARIDRRQVAGAEPGRA